MRKLTVGQQIVIDMSKTEYCTWECYKQSIVTGEITSAYSSGDFSAIITYDNGATQRLCFEQSAIHTPIQDRQTLADLVSVVQTFFDSRDIEVVNEEKLQAIGMGAEDIHKTTIYGSDWDELLEGFEAVLHSIGIDFKEDYS